MDLTKKMENITGMFMKKKFWTTCCAVTFALVMVFSLSGCTSGPGTEEVEELSQQESTDVSIEDGASAGDANTSINIPSDSDIDSMVSVSVENLGRANPFLPPGETALNPSAVNKAASVPQEKLLYDVLPPLETPKADASARRVASTRVSGIMYDKSNPSAILNIDGEDYFVRSGDVLNGYKVLSIGKSIVTVQVGSNVYKAGVGQLIEGVNNGINYNTIANLQNKFGGNKK